MKGIKKVVISYKYLSTSCEPHSWTNVSVFDLHRWMCIFCCKNSDNCYYLSMNLISFALPTSHRFHPSLSPVGPLSLGILHEWMRMQMLAKPLSNLLQRTGGDHRGGRAQLGWRTFMMTCVRWIFGYMWLEIWHKIGFNGDLCLLHGAVHS